MRQVDEKVLRKEAVRRLEYLKISTQVIEEFSKGNILCSNDFGKTYPVDAELQEKITEVESKGYLVYHVIKTETSYGDMYAMLVVSDYFEDWPRELILMGTEFLSISYVWNKSVEEWSEFGRIGCVSNRGRLVRSA